MTDDELKILEENTKTVRLADIFRNNVDSATEYFEKIQTPGKMLTGKSMKKHAEYVAAGDPIAAFLEEISAKYRISLKLLQDAIINNKDIVFNVSCPVCGKPLTHIKYFAKTCSQKCAAIYSQIAIRKTNIERYGVSCTWKTDAVKSKIKKTNIERYGVENPCQNEKVKEKAKATCIKKYGTEYASQSDVVKAKVRSTNMERYGVEHTFSSPEIQQAIRDTNIQKYGCAYFTSTDAFKAKAKETFLRNYGVENPMQSEEIRAKLKEAILEKYGVENVSQSEEIRAKVRRTNLERHGNEVFVKSETFRNRTKETNLRKYGVEHASQSEEIQEKIKQTNLERYGTEYSSQSEIVKKRVRKSNRKKTYNFFLSLLKNRGLEPLDDKETLLTSERINLKCTNCGEIFDVAYDNATQQSSIFCPVCHPKYSSPEMEIHSFLTQYIPGDEIIHKDRKVLQGNKELDIYIPTKKLAIEFDGLYWHNTDSHDIMYHLKKTEECKEKGIQLLHVLEHEWQYKSPIVKSIILAKLHIFEKVIFARKCKVKSLTNTEYREFLLENHIQGYAPATTRIGLFYEDSLVACIGIGKSRFQKNEIELIRFCTKLNTRVIGGLSRLIKHAKFDMPLVSYVDRRYFNGSGYVKAGFSEISTSSPGYIYCRKNETLSRYQCQKHKLRKLLGSSFNSALTEKQNMELAGYQQIYDCGMIKLVYGGDIQSVMAR